MQIGQLAGVVGKGLAAGLAGTAAMTVSSTLEAKLRGREPSTTPAQAVEKLTGVEPVNGKAEQSLNNLAHWGYGTAWGAVRGLLGAVGLHGPAATTAHLAAVWGAELAMLPALELAPPATQWGRVEAGIDLFHHAVYATATTLTYEWLDRR